MGFRNSRQNHDIFGKRPVFFACLVDFNQRKRSRNLCWHLAKWIYYDHFTLKLIWSEHWHIAIFNMYIADRLRREWVSHAAYEIMYHFWGRLYFRKYIDVVHGKEYLKENSRVFAGIVWTFTRLFKCNIPFFSCCENTMFRSCYLWNAVCRIAFVSVILCNKCMPIEWLRPRL